MKSLYFAGPSMGLLLALTGVACSDDEETAPASFTAVTYNGGLARGFVAGAEARQPLVAEAIAGLSADVVCVQEIWSPEDVSAVTAAAASRFPNAIFPEPTGPGATGTAACEQSDVQPLYDCAVANGCDMACGDEVVNCVLTACTAEFGALNTQFPNCSQCLQANVGKPSVDDILDACTSASAEFAFDGSFGIGLLTSHRIVAQQELVFDSTTNRRGVIYAELETDLGPVHAFCTHLTAIFDEMVIPYPRPTGSWQEEQAAQIDELIAFAAEKSGGEPTVIMGDFNTGPAGNGYAADHPEHHQRFLAAGYADPYVDSGGPCTFCNDNPLVGQDHDDSVLIDHVFVKGFGGATTSATRVLDQPVTAAICNVDQTVAVSDHYGVSVTVTAAAP